jgi:hypothetical protein
MDSKAKRICLVTIHGVGFEQAPERGIPGYADLLHQHLAARLDASLLGDDPRRQRKEHGEHGPVYVQSTWSHATEKGLVRLGAWGPNPRQVKHGKRQELTDDGQPIAHVALVYSDLEDQGPRLTSLAELAADAAGALVSGRYVSVVDAVRMALVDVRAMGPATAGEAPSSLRVRQEALRPAKRPAGRAPQASVAPEQKLPSGGLWTTILQLDHDVGAYVHRNVLRERVRGFVREALLRLIFRDDVAGVVVNAHSQGTVVAFDVLHDLPPFAATRVLGFVTSGSPLRKYVDVFHWGNEIGSIHDMPATDFGELHGIPWINFWDEHDPVADPLTPPQQWRPGDPTSQNDKASKGTTLFEWVNPNTGNVGQVRVADQRVDNLRNSVGGGLQAHNYWDNEGEVVEPLAKLLRHLVEQVKEQSGRSEPAAVAIGAPASSE